MRGMAEKTGLPVKKDLAKEKGYYSEIMYFTEYFF